MRVEPIGDRSSEYRSGAGDECDADIAGVSVEVPASPVVDRGGARVDLAGDP